MNLQVRCCACLLVVAATTSCQGDRRQPSADPVGTPTPSPLAAGASQLVLRGDVAEIITAKAECFQIGTARRLEFIGVTRSGGMSLMATDAASGLVQTNIGSRYYAIRGPTSIAFTAHQVTFHAVRLVSPSGRQTTTADGYLRC